MAARTLDQILTELRPTYDAQTQSLQERAGLIPQQIQSEESALKAREQDYFDNTILGGARRRGLGFSGIPEGERARYGATEFLPALARLRQSGQERAMSLQDAILGINERRDTLGQQIYQQEQDREFQRQQAELNRQAQERAARAAAAIPSFGGFDGSGGGNGGSNALPKISRTTKGGYNFTDAYGTPINAAEYVQLYNAAGGQQTYRSLLQRMANDGDANARVALNYVGDDFKFGNAPSNIAGALKALGASGSYAKAAPKPTPYNPNSGYRGNSLRTF